jgi:hypothetical protein
VKIKTHPRKPLPNGARAIMASRKEALKPFLDKDCKFCPTCNRAIVPDTAPMRPTARRILKLIERHGEMHPEVLHAALWGSDPNGGPNMDCLYVHVFWLNRALAAYGLAVVSDGSRGRGPYRLLSLPQALEAAE